MNITFIPNSGLCNRIRGIASAIFIANKLHANLIIRWNKEKGCNAAFSDLFNPIRLSNVVLKENKLFWYATPMRRTFIFQNISRTFYLIIEYMILIKTRLGISLIISKTLRIFCYHQLILCQNIIL